jgi:3-mercaptopyruvate sulfurtransferase SseA
VKTPQKILALVALLLATLALIVQNPKERHNVSVDVEQLARIVEQEEDHVTVDELVVMMKEGKSGLRIFDLRDSAAYQQYHIPGAKRIAMPELAKMRFQTTETVVLYSEGGIHAAQAWMLLAVQGQRNVFTLKGGLLEWQERTRKVDAPRPRPRHDSTNVKPPVQKFEKEEEKLREVC